MNDIYYGKCIKIERKEDFFMLMKELEFLGYHWKNRIPPTIIPQPVLCDFDYKEDVIDLWFWKKERRIGYVHKTVAKERKMNIITYLNVSKGVNLYDV